VICIVFVLSIHHKYSIYYNSRASAGRTQPPYHATSSGSHLAVESYARPGDFPQLGADLSFEAGISIGQTAYFNMALAGIGIGLITHPVLVLTGFSWLLFTTFSSLIAWRILLLFVGVCLRITHCDTPLKRANSLDLPVYSVLVPAYREANLMPQIARSLSRLNWPASRLDIQILLEADDTDTIVAARDANFAPNTRLTLIAPGGPRTKPNALNIGLSEARGRYITVFDAEDFPHPDQLRAAFEAFQSAPSDLVCLQAPLIGTVHTNSWLSAQWSLEYAVQFGLLLPGAALYRMPLLIGGTSNHFRKEALQALGGWDAWNVTEDADLGMRIARAGLSCGVISLPTSEDPPRQLRVWMAQRSRWIKGFLQTWLVLMRTPSKTRRQMGAVSFTAMQLSLGGAILAPMFHLPCVLLLILAMLSEQFVLGTMGTGLLTVALTVGFFGDVCAPGPRTIARWVATLTRPLYWPLHSIAAYRAIWELANDPFFWAKTPHTPRNLEDTASCSTGSSASACF